MLVTLSFGLITICAMLMVVWLGIQRVSTPRLQKWYRFSHALAGAAVLACGFAMAVGL